MWEDGWVHEKLGDCVVGEASVREDMWKGSLCVQEGD